MILRAHKLDGKKIRTGRTVWFTSTDLKSWGFRIEKTISLHAEGSVAETYLCTNTADLFKLETRISFSPGTRVFGIRQFEDEATGDAYEFIFQVAENRHAFKGPPTCPGSAI